jgi:hypothetical protein
MFRWVDFIVAHRHYEELLLEAEKGRILKQLQSRDRGMLERATLWLGRRLVISGRRMMDRYGGCNTDPCLKGAHSR